MQVPCCNMDLNFADIFQWVLIQNVKMQAPESTTNLPSLTGIVNLITGHVTPDSKPPHNQKIANNIFSMRVSSAMRIGQHSSL